MIGGSVIVGACLVVLGWTAEIVSLFVTEEHLVSQTNRSAERWPADGIAAETIMYNCPGCS